MASQGQGITENSSDIGQAQLIRDEYANHASNISEQVEASNHQSAQDKATNFLRQTGEQMKNMAQGAANAMKNTLGRGITDTSSNTTTSLPINNPIYPSHPSNPTNPSNNRI